MKTGVWMLNGTLKRVDACRGSLATWFCRGETGNLARQQCLANTVGRARDSAQVPRAPDVRRWENHAVIQTAGFTEKHECCLLA